MSTLSGQTIQSTYQGLLKLATSTSGVTSTPQQIQDGLGNDTGARIATNFLTAPNVFPMNITTNFTPDYMGPGFVATQITPQANQQNKLTAFLFYDPGKYAYSAITYQIVTQTSSSDVVDVAFYNTQYLDDTGVVPYELIMSGITLLTTPSGSGIISTTLPSTLSFSGSGGGFYYMVCKISNSGVTPTVRYSVNQATTLSWGSFTSSMLGLARNRSNNALSAALGTNGNSAGYIMTATSFAPTFSSADCAINTTVNPYNLGFALKCVK